ncbi:hypothetical protein AN963_10250 [Brevibacillus choshinensis]|uniref:Uncharacterized protein n=1 Tax=Brevibacillus choshinensis TaxID=54911 RepID=A0ABR5NEM7_BRECH|nr:hypothetical protein [Brevibacillus choshinensis]KQL50025.1 hypothetical protein AN963_10250 [Brevibacillus choshinensis]
MRLIGSKIEQDIRSELINSHEALFTAKSEKRFLETLERHLPSMVTAYVLNWIPEQGEDILTYLVNIDTVAIIEINRVDQSVEPIVEILPLSEYKRGLSKIKQIKIAVAIDLARKDIEAKLN